MPVLVCQKSPRKQGLSHCAGGPGKSQATNAHLQPKNAIKLPYLFLDYFPSCGYKYSQWCCNTRDGESYVNRHMTPGPRALKGGVDYSWCYTRISKATALQRDPRAGGIRPTPWPRDFGRWAVTRGAQKPFCYLGFLAAPKSQMTRKWRADFCYN